MRESTSADLLSLWERVSRCGPHERGLHMLAWAMPEYGFDALADLDLGVRDWHLLRLRRSLFGPVLNSFTECPHCGERLEMELDARVMQEDTPPPPAPFYIDREGRRYRLPNSRDLIMIASKQEPHVAARALFTRCDVDASTDEHGFDEASFDEVDVGLSALAAERNFQLDVSCAVCGQSWSLSFDPGAFLWEEIRAHAAWLLNEVHCLGAAYGWSERDILAMSETRRAAYLDRLH